MVYWNALEVRDTPYPLALIPAPAIPRAQYAALASTYPDPSVWKEMHTGGTVKYSLSPVRHKDAYQAFIQSSPPWKALWLSIQSQAWIWNALYELQAAGFPLVLDESDAVKYKARFEFSILPGQGGCLPPHRDLPSKVVTMILGMPDPTVPWQEAWGGGTDILVPKPETVDPQDHQTPREAFDLVMTYPYRANQMTIFKKTDTSWHSVGPLDAPMPRRSITINIEKFDR